MLSVQTEILEKSHYDFVNEQKKMLRIEEQLLRIIEELNTQSEQTFIAHIFSLNKLRRVILQEIEGLNSLLTGLDDIRQMYEECERKNMNIDQQVSGGTNNVDSINEADPSFWGKGKGIRYYDEEEISEIFDKWIKPLLK